MLTDCCSENLKGRDHLNFGLVGTIILKLLLQENGVMDWNMSQDWFQRLSLLNKLIAFMCHASEGVPNQMTTNYLKIDSPTLCEPSLCSHIYIYIYIYIYISTSVLCALSSYLCIYSILFYLLYKYDTVVKKPYPLGNTIPVWHLWYKQHHCVQWTNNWLWNTKPGAMILCFYSPGFLQIDLFWLQFSFP
jgi:hypothetical protein